MHLERKWHYMFCILTMAILKKEFGREGEKLCKQMRQNKIILYIERPCPYFSKEKS
jgi:hypothetical protein